MSDRGEPFLGTARELKGVITRGEDTVVEMAEGIDAVCVSCPECRDGRCESIHGQEHKVRKWDARILEGLGLAYGDRLEARELRRLVLEKTPLAFCRERCPWGSVCRVFEKEGGPFSGE
jgi:hypothetical protein